MNYYLITEKCRDGEHEYYTDVPVQSLKLKADWERDWETLFLHWQYCIDWIDENELWSDNRIVSVYFIKDLTKEEFECMGKLMSGTFQMEDIIEEGKANVKERENNG